MISGLRTLFLFLLRFRRNGRSYRLDVALVIAAGIVSGLASTALLAVISSFLHASGASRPTLGITFAALCLLLPVARFFSSVLLIRLSQSTLCDLRVHLGRRILAAPLRQLEELGAHRLLATLTDDVSNITTALANTPLVVMQLTVVIGCLIYLGSLSVPLLLVVLVFVAIGIASYRLPLSRADRYLQGGRESWDRLLRHLQGLTQGTKELKLHRLRREAFLSDHLEPTAMSLRDAYVRGNVIYAGAQSWGQVLFFVVIGLILFVVPGSWTGGTEILGGFTLAILYMLTPLDVVMGALPWLARASVSVRKIEALGISLAPEMPDTAVASWPRDEGPPRLELVSVTHTYYDERDNHRFTLGPLDLDFRPGDLVFVVGGNGSGKTTFAKLLLGLYRPETGEIRVDGEPVTEQTAEAHRQAFSAVFTDFYLFEHLMGLACRELDDRAMEYLGRLQLDRKVKVEAGALSTLDLSQGQRKRLALVTAYLEDRPIYLFDEWAADQDPQFKETFYLELLPELRARGKTVFVISHDDRYFHVADRILKLNYGRIEYDGPVATYLARAAVVSASPGPPAFQRRHERRTK